ncbi:unnamed protein product [Acanthoscelides obtectus]|uniref:ZP domain-containing protein n=1 Tax=Acanthoscelides obtectus TaxID=200917 RepID=A0A9P0PGU1_ACAOB|nr:unnamed protein product [Acanthoscelides obtectus]CAK1666225.1 hypothetical protein AOBTE_LOCUS25218 [Acanthoscelides obtectus]
MKILLVPVVLLATSMLVGSTTAQQFGNNYNKLGRNSRLTRESPSADQMVQNILRWLEGAYTKQSRRSRFAQGEDHYWPLYPPLDQFSPRFGDDAFRQGTIKEYLPPFNTDKPHGFTPAPPGSGGVDEEGNFVDSGYPPSGSSPQPPFTLPPSGAPSEKPGFPTAPPPGYTPSVTGPERPGTTQPGYTPGVPGATEEPQKPGFPTQPPPGYTPSVTGPTEQPEKPGFPTQPEAPGTSAPETTPGQPEGPAVTTSPGYTYKVPETTPSIPGGTPGVPTEGPERPGTEGPAPEVTPGPEGPEGTTSRPGVTEKEPSSTVPGETPQEPKATPEGPEGPEGPTEGPGEPEPTEGTGETEPGPKLPEGPTEVSTEGPGGPVPTVPGEPQVTTKGPEEPGKEPGPAEAPEVPETSPSLPGGPTEEPGEPEKEPTGAPEEPKVPEATEGPEVPQTSPTEPGVEGPTEEPIQPGNEPAVTEGPEEPSPKQPEGTTEEPGKESGATEEPGEPGTSPKLPEGTTVSVEPGKEPEGPTEGSGEPEGSTEGSGEQPEGTKEPEVPGASTKLSEGSTEPGIAPEGTTEGPATSPKIPEGPTEETVSEKATGGEEVPGTNIPGEATEGPATSPKLPERPTEETGVSEGGEIPGMSSKTPEVPTEGPEEPGKEPTQGTGEPGKEPEGSTEATAVPTATEEPIAPSAQTSEGPETTEAAGSTTKQPTPEQPSGTETTPKPEGPETPGPKELPTTPGEEPGTTKAPESPDDERHPPHIHAIDVECGKEMMTINIEFNRPFNGVIYSKGYYNMPECRYVQENSNQIKFSFTVNLNMCGTEFVNAFDTEGQSYLENVLVLQNEPGIQEVWDTVRSVRCLWEGNLKEQLSVSLMVGMLSQEIVTFSGDTAMAKLDVLQGRGAFGQPANGLVKIGDPLTLVVSVSGDPGFDVQVKDCRATDSTGSNTIPLTDDDGCILKPKLFGAFQKTRNTENTGASVIAYAYFNAFKFPDVMDLMIECNIELCKTDCEMCPKTDQALEPAKRRRRRREANNATMLHDGVAMGKHLRVILPEDLASATASLGNEITSVCMSTHSFVFGSSLLVSLLTASCVLTAYIWLKRSRQETSKLATY